jgi:hypothetical protein
MKKSDQAMAAIREAEQAAGAIKDHLSRAYAWLNLSAVARASGDQAAARKLLDKAEQAGGQVGDQGMTRPLMEDIDRARQRL